MSNASFKQIVEEKRLIVIVREDDGWSSRGFEVNIINPVNNTIIELMTSTNEYSVIPFAEYGIRTIKDKASIIDSIEEILDRYCVDTSDKEYGNSIEEIESLSEIIRLATEDIDKLAEEIVLPKNYILDLSIYKERKL